MIQHLTFEYFDNAGRWHSVVQVWARIPATGVWAIVSSHELDVDPADVPVRPTRPV